MPHNEQRPQSIVFDLPIELILYLQDREWITLTEFLNLALSCKHFYGLLMPVLLSRFDLLGNPLKAASLSLNRYKDLPGFAHPPQNSWGIPSSPLPDSLSILDVAFHIQSIPKLQCTFHGYFFDVIVHQVKRLNHALSRLLDVEDIELIFGPADNGYDLRGRLDTRDDVLQLWIDAFGGLLNTTVQKGPRRLAVRDGFVMIQTFLRPGPSERSTKPAKTSPFHFITTLWKPQKPHYIGIHGEVIRAPPHSIIVPHFPATIRETQISTLEICSPIMFLPPFSYWTFSLLKVSPMLTVLVMSDLIVFSSMWGSYLSLLSDCLSTAGSTLLSFTMIRCRPMSAAVIVGFLCNLPNLMTLVLDASSKGRGYLEKEPIPFLPKLKMLEAPAYILRFLLSPSSRSDPTERSLDTQSLQILEGVRICDAAYLISDKFNHHDTSSPSLTAIQARAKRLETIALIFENDWSWSKWMEDEGSDVGLQEFSHVTDLVIALHCFGCEPKRIPQELCMLGFLEFAIPNPMFQTACSFIRRFPGAYRLTVYQPPTRNNFRESLPLRLPSPEEVNLFITELTISCPQLQWVNVLDFVHTTTS
ncbi:hypothetical protein BDN72DRAFT_961099 [Pluteus cervinus]|uniref:Uncharacterized protein n=1 Tax=Pluteus cervinus TaxID=181527 RepID=A0ACD3AN12_9AGAR|nr:hypothetical protein BDN72DRAFT_961099 [Pluteus cervinus]